MFSNSARSRFKILLNNEHSPHYNIPLIIRNKKDFSSCHTNVLRPIILGACGRTNCDGIGHPANVATCARMTLCPISFIIHFNIHLSSFIYCTKEHFLCFLFNIMQKYMHICTEFHIN
jgi:hypothetical protein